VWFQGYIRPEDVEAFENSQNTSAAEEENDPVESFDDHEEGDANSSSEIRSEAQRLVAAARNIKAGRQKYNRRVISAVAGWGTLAAIIVLAAGLSVHYRQNIVKMLPGSAQFYARLGMPVNVRGMSFANVVYKRDFENGLPVLAIKGEVVNLTSQKKILPRVRFGLLDETDRELYHWSVRVDKKPIGPNARVKFVTRLSSPPAGAKGLMVRFAKATSGYGVYR